VTLRRTETGGLALIVLMFGLAAWGWVSAGGHGAVPVHWDLAGDPNGYAPPVVAFGVAPIASLLVLGVLLVIPRVDPRREHLLQSEKAYSVIGLAILGFLAVVQVLAVTAALSGHFQAGVLTASLGLLLAVIGNYFGKLRSSWFVGLRTPWTLSSELSWDRTHRLGGRIFVAAGLLCLLLSIVSSGLALLALLLSLIGAAPVVVVYSYLVWRADPAPGRQARAMPSRLRLGVLLAVLGAVLVGAAVAIITFTSPGKVLTGSDRVRVLAYSEPQTDNLMAAYRADDYAAATRDFDAVMRRGLTQAVFESARQTVTRTDGVYLSRSVSEVLEMRGYTTVVYRDRFSSRDIVMSVSFAAASPHQVTGWWFH